MYQDRRRETTITLATILGREGFNDSRIKLETWYDYAQVAGSLLQKRNGLVRHGGCGLGRGGRASGRF